MSVPHVLARVEMDRWPKRIYRRHGVQYSVPPYFRYVYAHVDDTGKQCGHKHRSARTAGRCRG